MSKINPEHLAALAKSCTYEVGSLEWADYITKELQRIGNIEEQISGFQKAIHISDYNHAKEVDDLEAKIVGLQKTCKHESVEHTPRGTAEGEASDVCRICGKVL